MVNMGKFDFSLFGKAWGPLSGLIGGMMVTLALALGGISPLEP